MAEYYIIHPNGREKLKAADKQAALNEFREHWTARADWIKGKKPLVRRLMETRTEEIHSEPIP
jgi:hypothetical protein